MGVISDYVFGALQKPAFLAGRNISSFLRSVAQVGDSYAQRVLDGRVEWTTEKASRNALFALARNANDRGFDREALSGLRTYILDIIAQHRMKGTEDGIKAQFARIGCTNIEIVTELTLRNAGAVNPFGGNVGFFFVVVRQPCPFVFTVGAWDGGGSWDDDTSRWGWSGDTDNIGDITDILRRWKPVNTSCRFVIFDEDGTAGWNAGGLVGSYVQFPINESWETLPSGLVFHYYNTTFTTP